ncbi:MAG: hypothetical protein OEX02_03180 [Cyclobacteriaceae bacterium]|nr:hypothetical protein [Cyclobacteriaceae bacterium]
MRQLKGLFAFSLLVSLIACLSEDQQGEVDMYFDMEQLTAQQVHLLNAMHASIEKKAVLDGVEETIVYTPDTTNWRHELEVFSVANINKAIYKGSYTFYDETDIKSNLTIRTYTHIDTTEARIPWMKVYFLNNPDHYHQVELKYKEENKVYQLERLLSMSFEDINDQMVLSSYSVQGHQEVIGDKSIAFEVHALIDL